jgi:hypothetical protein
MIASKALSPKEIDDVVEPTLQPLSAIKPSKTTTIEGVRDLTRP